MTPKVLALDFDGVIWDSAGECFEVGWRAYRELFQVDLSGESYRDKFLAGRPHARTGHDFFLLLRLLETRPEVDLERFPWPEFVALRQALAVEAAAFNAIFYDLRAKYREQDFPLWASWQAPYAEMVAVLDRWESRFAGAALATTKDEASAHALLRSAGRDWPVFGKEFSLNKEEQIRGIAAKYGVHTEEILFMDDLLENLEQVKPTGAALVLASWGYNTAESREEAQAQGYRVLDAKGFESLLEELVDEVEV